MKKLVKQAAVPPLPAPPALWHNNLKQAQVFNPLSFIRSFFLHSI